MSDTSSAQNVFIREATKETPFMRLDPESGLLEFEGASLPENPIGVYSPVLDWLRSYITHPAGKTTLRFNFTYYNTSTSKVILGILELLEELHRGGEKVQVEWTFPEEDEDMEEAGHEYAATTMLPFIIKENVEGE